MGKVARACFCLRFERPPENFKKNRNRLNTLLEPKNIAQMFQHSFFKRSTKMCEVTDTHKLSHAWNPYLDSAISSPKENAACQLRESLGERARSNKQPFFIEYPPFVWELDVRDVCGSNHTTTFPQIQEKQLAYCQTVCVPKAKCLSGPAEPGKVGLQLDPASFSFSFNIFLY